MSAQDLLLIILLLPLVSAGTILLFFRDRGVAASLLALIASAGVLAASVLLFRLGEPAGAGLPLEWFTLGSFSFSLGFLYDANTALLLLVVAVVSFLVHLFSLGYMADDDAKGRYFGGLSAFSFSMLGIVVADNLAMIFVFWELVGFSSYMLIAHYSRTSEAADASKKAFIVNRVGDFGFLIGIVWAFWHFGTLNLTEMSALVGQDAGLVRTGMVLLLMCGFIGKSAQFPLHVWLPDAMAGPTPVSALIHAATMVAAGIFLLVRIAFLFTPEALQVVLWLGVGMGFAAGIVALGQNDIKKILAYSTLSQLGYMAAAFGLGMPGLALFHLATHAFFKALLFLGAGSVIHGCHHEQDIYRMGGLLRRMPVTAISFIIGTAALLGVNFTSGYWSKEAILTAAYADHRGAITLLWLGAIITAFYMGRLLVVAFFGKPRSEAAESAHEGPWSMQLPLIILAVLSLISGFYHFWPSALSGAFFAEVDAIYRGEAYAGFHTIMLVLGTSAWVIGLAGALWFYRSPAPSDRLERDAPFLFGILQKRLFIDDLYDAYVRNVQQRVCDVLSFIDLFMISGLFVRGTAGLVGLLGIVSRSLHAGHVHGYVYWFLGGLLLFWAFAGGLF